MSPKAHEVKAGWPVWYDAGGAGAVRRKSEGDIRKWDPPLLSHFLATTG